MPKRLIAGNWKMNGLKAAVSEAETVAKSLSEQSADCDVLICPPATLIAVFEEKLTGTAVQYGGQDCHTNESGAHTGDISAEMLADLGCAFGIVGHSERRTDHGETNDEVKAKAYALTRANVLPIICIGETQSERESGNTLKVLTEQVENSVPTDLDGTKMVVAYEPVWAIGTGLVPELSDIEEAHNHIRATLTNMGIANADEIRLLYGGSVKPGNAGEILTVSNVNGALVGGASLKAADFLGIIRA
ncbi:triose-phosphate isomerase [Ponticaulis profundi]|uniref:Triosephosphate isomerase n=1 Tax=Ponticaulis profundi TaxID=2665222 RepID=A0ABW1SED1_9PROT